MPWRKGKEHIYKASQIVHHKWPRLMADLLFWIDDTIYSFISLHRKTEKSSAIRSISPEWKTGFLKQIKDDKEFHKTKGVFLL